MKNGILFFEILSFMLTTALAMPILANAHGTGHRVLTDEYMVALEFYYSDQTPMRYAEALVFSPKDADVEHQYARTDQHGKLVFCPDVQGHWLVKVNDGMGHAEQATVMVEPESISRTGETSQVTPHAASQPPIGIKFKVVTGLSLILNAFFIVYLVKRGTATNV